MKYKVKVQFHVWDVYEVEAESEDEAYEKAEDMAGDKSLNEMNNSFEGCTIIDSEPESEAPDDDTPEEMKAALDYMREQLDEDELTIYKATVSRNLNQRMDASTGLDDCKIIDLLEEYGADNDLPEGWWENYGDIDEWMMWL